MRVENLIFIGSREIGAVAIRLATIHWSSHVLLELSDGSMIESLWPYGVVRRFDRTFSPGTRVERYRIDLPEQQREEAFKRANRQIGRPYDVRWIGGFLFFHRHWQDPSAWVCSELAAHALPGLLNFGSLSRITPRDLLLSPHLKRNVE